MPVSTYRQFASHASEYVQAVCRSCQRACTNWCSLRVTPACMRLDLYVAPSSIHVYNQAWFTVYVYNQAWFAGCTSVYIQPGLVYSYIIPVCMHATRLGLHHTSVYVYNQFWYTGHTCMHTIRLGLLVTPGCMCHLA